MTFKIINSSSINVIYMSVIYTSIPTRLRQRAIRFSILSDFILPLDGDKSLILTPFTVKKLHNLLKIQTEFDLYMRLN